MKTTMVLEMTNEESYVAWLYNMVAGNDPKRGSYAKLIIALYSRNFYSPIPNDENRFLDGLSLRKKFDVCNAFDIYGELANKPCSVLEMMISLADKVESTFFGTQNYINGMDFFWTMIVNLDLAGMDDNNYDDIYVNRVIDRFLSRNYGPNGEGSLFLYLNGCKIDLHNTEIWKQMQQYLNSLD